MKQFAKEFLFRGLICAAGGPVVLAVIYGIQGALGQVESLTPGEVCTAILSITVMAFLAAGITAVYQAERLPLLSAVLLHGGILYADYLLMYFLNSWIPRNWKGIGIFTAVFVIGYALTWLCIYLSIRRKTQRINQKLKG